MRRRKCKNFSKNFKKFQKISKNFKNFKKIQKIQKNSKKFKKNSKNPEKIQKNLKKSQKISKSTNNNWAMGEFYELRNFMNAWSQQEQEQEQQELHESSANRLYECKPVIKKEIMRIHAPRQEETFKNALSRVLTG